MFSTSPMIPTASTLALRFASACINPTTAAAPPISPFIPIIEFAGLSESPPESKHTPLPTKASGPSDFDFFARAPFHCITTMRESWMLPWPTPKSAFIPSFFISGTPNISTLTPSFLSASVRLANSSG